LPYFAKTYGLKVAGLDYSEVGCVQAEMVLRGEGITGEIVHGDLFSPPPQFVGSFDVAVSQGLVEHFEETAIPVRAIAALLRPRGLMVTTIPNLAGILGRVQEMINKPIYDVHVPLTALELADAHREAGLLIVASGYLVPVNFGVCNLAGLNGVRQKLASEVVRTLIRLSYIPWAIDERHALPETQGFSGYAYCVAAKG
jgi:SAM-dependent methyltransferase